MGGGFSDLMEPGSSYIESTGLITRILVRYDTLTGEAAARVVSEKEFRAVRADQNGLPAEPQKPLTARHQKAFNLICEQGPLTGKQIVRRLLLTSESLFTGKYVPELKKHGICNLPGLGYYHPDYYKPGPEPVGKR